MNIKSFNQFITEKRSSEILNPKRGKWIKIDPKKHKELDSEFFNLIQTAYQPIGGHVKINKPLDVFDNPKWTYWKGIDIHKSPDVDIIIWGKNTKYGVKFSGVGHDGEKASKKKYLQDRMSDLKKRGFFGEVSGRLAEILLTTGTPHISNESDVEKVLGKDITWHGKHPTDNIPGKGWYSRMIGGQPHTKILVGKPKI